jgi:hypothetical protein
MLYLQTTEVDVLKKKLMDVRLQWGEGEGGAGNDKRCHHSKKMFLDQGLACHSLALNLQRSANSEVKITFYHEVEK